MLAATIFAVIYKFFHFDEPFKLYRVGMADTVMWLATFAATMGLSVKDGIVVGMAVSAFTLIQRWEFGVVRSGWGAGAHVWLRAEHSIQLLCCVGLRVMGSSSLAARHSSERGRRGMLSPACVLREAWCLA